MAAGHKLLVICCIGTMALAAWCLNSPAQAQVAPPPAASLSQAFGGLYQQIDDKAAQATTSLAAWDQGQSDLRQAIWRLHDRTTLAGKDARGRTLAEDLQDSVMTADVRVRWQQARARAEQRYAAGDEPGGRAALVAELPALKQQLRYLFSISYYWARWQSLDAVRQLWLQWVSRDPGSMAEAGKQRIHLLESALAPDLSDDVTPQSVEGRFGELAKAYNEERQSLAWQVSERQEAAGEAMGDHASGIPCPETDPAGNSGSPDRGIRPDHMVSADEYYPLAAKRDTLEGKVFVRLTVSASGCLLRTSVLRSAGSPLLDQAAIEVAEHSSFLPAIEHGQPVEAKAVLPVTFVMLPADARGARGVRGAREVRGTAQSRTYVQMVMHGNQLLEQGKIDDAITEFNAVLEKDPGNSLALANRGIAYYWKHDKERSMQDLDAAFAFNPVNPVVFHGRGMWAMQQYELPSAIDNFSTAILLEPDDGFAYKQRAEARRRAGDAGQALADCDALVRLQPTVAVNYLIRAAYRAAKDRAGERADIDTALKLDPKSWQGWVALARWQSDGGDYAGAIASLTTALGINNHSMSLLILRGAAYSGNGQEPLAAQDLAAARTAAFAGVVESGMPDARNDFCYELAVANVQLEQALAECELAVAAQPKDSFLLDSRGFVLLRLGRYAESIRSYDAALALAPQFSTSLYGRGIAKRRSGDAAGSGMDIRSALALDAHLGEEFEGYGIKP